MIQKQIKRLKAAQAGKEKQVYALSELINYLKSVEDMPLEVKEIKHIQYLAKKFNTVTGFYK